MGVRDSDKGRRGRTESEDAHTQVEVSFGVGRAQFVCAHWRAAAGVVVARTRARVRFTVGCGMSVAGTMDESGPGKGVGQDTMGVHAAGTGASRGAVGMGITGVGASRGTLSKGEGAGRGGMGMGAVGRA